VKENWTDKVGQCISVLFARHDVLLLLLLLLLLAITIRLISHLVVVLFERSSGWLTGNRVERQGFYNLIQMLCYGLMSRLVPNGISATAVGLSYSIWA
jgi:hypothetical protein